MVRRTYRLIAIALILVLAASSLSGCGGTVAGAMAALKIGAVAAMVADDKSSGSSWVTILADIFSGNAVRRAIARIISPSTGEIAEVVLELNSSGKYEGQYLADPSPSQTTSEEYQVEVTATDTTGDVAVSDPVTFEVPPSSAP
jgi:predicted small secreted protein